jgi:hypothetical protein
MVALMMIALGGLHSLTRAATTPPLYRGAPAALVGALLIVLCGSKGPTLGAPLPRPDRRVPAMAKRPASAREDVDEIYEVVDWKKADRLRVR